MRRICVALIVTLLAGPAVLIAGGAEPAAAAFPGENGKIVFGAQAPTGVIGIWVMDADGSDRTLLYGEGVGGSNPTWSADGTKIAFDTLFSTPSGCIGSDIYVMDADGSNVTPLTSTTLGVSELDPTWSPDGQQIAYTLLAHDPTCNSATQDIWKMDADGSNPTQLTVDPPGTFTSEEYPAWSPDGSKIAFKSDRVDTDGNSFQQIYSMNPDGSQVTRLTNTNAVANASVWMPAWSPDGQRIAFPRVPNSTFVMDIYTMDAGGGNETNMTQEEFDFAFEPAWSPDGQQIAFQVFDPPATTNDIKTLG